MQQSLLIDLDVTWKEAENSVKTKIRLSILRGTRALFYLFGYVTRPYYSAYFLKNDTRIMTTESKSIGQSYVHFALLCFVEREVQVIVDVFVVITLFVVDGRRDNAILDGEDACNGFYRTGSAQQVAGHGFCRTDVQLITHAVRIPL